MERISIVQGGVLTQLKSAYVGDDRPAILDLYSGGVRIHDPVAVRDDIEEMADWSLAQAFFMQGRWRRKTSRNDHPIAFAGLAMANGAINIKAFAPMLYLLTRHRSRKGGD